MTATDELAGNEVLLHMHNPHIAIVTLNRPHVRNAINGALASGLDRIVKQTEADPAIRVVILTSSNAKVFCAGADLSEIAQGRAASLSTPDGGFAGFTDAQRGKPWIAAVEGFVLAGGCELALACDMIVAAPDAKFGLPEVKRGLFAGAGGVHRLPRALPRNIALELVATGDLLPVERAYALGLVNRIAPAGELLPTAIALAEAIAANAPLSVQASLAVARLHAEKSDSELRTLSLAAADRVFASEDAQEGPRAFLEKRAPVWTADRA